MRRMLGGDAMSKFTMLTLFIYSLQTSPQAVPYNKGSTLSLIDVVAHSGGI